MWNYWNLKNRVFQCFGYWKGQYICIVWILSIKINVSWLIGKNKYYSSKSPAYDIRDRGSHPEVFCINSVLKNFGKFAQKHLCQSLFLIKLRIFTINFIEKETLAQIFSCEICEIFKIDVWLVSRRSIAIWPPLFFWDQYFTGKLNEKPQKLWEMYFMSKIFRFGPG